MFYAEIIGDFAVKWTNNSYTPFSFKRKSQDILGQFSDIYNWDSTKLANDLHIYISNSETISWAQTVYRFSLLEFLRVTWNSTCLKPHMVLHWSLSWWIVQHLAKNLGSFLKFSFSSSYDLCLNVPCKSSCVMWAGF